MNYGLNMKFKLLLAFMVASLIAGASAGMWKIGVGMFLLCVSFLFYDLHKRQKNLNK